MNSIRIGIAGVCLLVMTACGQATTPETTATEPPTETPEPTSTLTSTPVPTETEAPTITPSPTPDMRVIDANPRNLVEIGPILPDDARFYLTYESPGRNSEMISNWGVDEGRRYLAESGRVDGWSIEYTRGTRTVYAPEFVRVNGVLFSTVDGPAAAASLRENNEPCTDQESLASWGTTLLENDFIEDASQSYLCVFREMQSSGENYVVFYADIDVRNVGLQVWAGGLEDDYSQDWVMDFLDGLVEHVSSFELSEQVTWSP